MRQRRIASVVVGSQGGDVSLIQKFVGQRKEQTNSKKHRSDEDQSMASLSGSKYSMAASIARKSVNSQNNHGKKI